MTASDSENGCSGQEKSLIALMSVSQDSQWYQLPEGRMHCTSIQFLRPCERTTRRRHDRIWRASEQDLKVPFLERCFSDSLSICPVPKSS